MTRRELHILAEEMLKLMPKDYTHDTILTAKELAKRLGTSISWVNHHGHELPRFKVGHEWRFPLNEVINQLKM